MSEKAPGRKRSMSSGGSSRISPSVNASAALTPVKKKRSRSLSFQSRSSTGKGQGKKKRRSSSFQSRSSADDRRSSEKKRQPSSRGYARSSSAVSSLGESGASVDSGDEGGAAADPRGVVVEVPAANILAEGMAAAAATTEEEDEDVEVSQATDAASRVFTPIGASSGRSASSVSPAGAASVASGVSQPMPCAGVRKGTNKQLLGFVVKSYRKTANHLEQVAMGTAQYNKPPLSNSSAFLLPHRGTKISKEEDGTYWLKDEKCEEKARAPQSMRKQVPTRCGKCETRRKSIKKEVQSDSPVRTPSPTASTTSGVRIDILSQSPISADQEIRRLRIENKKLRRQNTRLSEKVAEKHAWVVENKDQVDWVSRAYRDGNRLVQAAKDLDSDTKNLVEVMTNRFLLISQRGHQYNIPVDESLLDFLTCFLKKHGWSAYNDFAVAMKMPSVSYVQKKANERGASAQSRAHGVYADTITAINSLLLEAGCKKGSTQRIGSMSFDSAEVRQGYKFDHNSLTYVGGADDDAMRYSIVKKKFESMARAAAENELEGEILKNVRLAKHHLICKWTSLSPTKLLPGGEKMSYVVASIDMADLDESLISNVIMATISSLNVADLVTALIVCDAAGENIRLLNLYGDIKASAMLPDDLKAKFPLIDFSIPCVTKAFGSLMVLILDMPHLVKCIGGAVERSSRKKSKRDLMRDDDPINSGAIKGGWEAVGGRSHQLGFETKLTESHFTTTPFSAMNVALRVQLMSESVARLLEKIMNDPQIKVSLPRERYASLVQFCRKIDRLVDICNGRSTKKEEYTAYFTPSTARAIQEELLGILSWFADWRNKNIAAIAAETRTKWNFLPEQTWRNLNWLVIGLVVLIEHYCITEQRTLVPKNTNTDPCENHFSVTRNKGGSTASRDVAGFRSSDSGSTQFQLGRASLNNRIRGSNNADAPPDEESTTKKMFGKAKKW